MKAEQALQRFAERRETWSKRYGPQFADKVRESKEATLEHHLRSHFVDDVLRSLNWSLNVEDAEEPNLLAELPIISADSGRTKFIDYLGLEATTATPLMIVETKRFGAPLPQSPDDPKKWVPAILAEALAGNNDVLTHDWPEWLEAVSTYVRSAAARGGVPRRAVMTDGAWIIVFTNPNATFVEGRGNPNAISGADIAFFSFDRIEAEHADLYELLEYQHVLGEMPPLTPAELGFHIQPEHADRIMHGVRVIFTADPGFLEPSPRIKVKPVLLLATTFGGWIVIEEPEPGEVLPTREDLLVLHLDVVRDRAERLAADVSAQFGRAFVPVSLASHYADPNAFQPMPGVRYQTAGGGDRRFIVATGRYTHYLRPEPSVPHCPFHDWSAAHGHADAPRGQSVEPPSFFSSGALHYCGHRAVGQVKHSPATKMNRGRTGLRSAPEGGAFCEVWSLDQFLCCRTCAFEEVCARSELFTLPCQTTGEEELPV
jgi:hypothetical protein